MKNKIFAEKQVHKKLKTILISGLVVLLTSTMISGIFIHRNQLESQDANLSSSPLGLDPENDAIIYGEGTSLPIRIHNVSGTSGPNYVVPYVTMGTFSGASVNWLLCALNPSWVTETSTPAGAAIAECNSLQTCANITFTSDLTSNQLLLISEKAYSISFFSCAAHASAGTSFVRGSGGQVWGNMNNAASALMDEATDYYSSYSFTASNDYVTNFGLSSNAKVVVNSNFSSNKVFNLSSSQLTSYISSSFRVGKNTSGTAVKYIFRDSISFSISKSASFASSVEYGKDYYWPSGSGTCSFQVKNCSISGGVETTSVAVIEASFGGRNGSLVAHPYSDTYYYNSTCSYSVTTNNASSYYVRPAMVIDVTK